MQLDDGECSDIFDVEQCLRQGCVTLLVNMLSTAMLRVAKKRFIADTAFMDNMVQLQQKKENGEKGKARAGKVG